MNRRSLILLVLVGLFWSGVLLVLPGRGQAGSQHAATGRGGAVATVDARATQVGIDVLRQGGNAVDAAIATAAALEVVRPLSCGIGGGGFLMLYLKEQERVLTFDSRETAPAAVTPDLFRDPDDSEGGLLPFYPNRISSGRAVGVPGTPLLWDEVLRRYGTLSLAEALAPAITLAEEGFIVSETLHRQIAWNQDRFAAFTSTRDLFLPNGAPPAAGSHWRNPDLAKAYRLLANQGINSFYRGEIAQAMVETVQLPPTVANPPFPVLPGAMTLADLDRYELRVRPPVITEYRGHNVFGMGLPSSGGITVAQALELLEEVDLSTMDTVTVWHHLIEAQRLAYADRNAYLGDPEYVDVPVAGLLSSAYARQRQPLIPAQASTTEVQPGNPLEFQTDPSPSLTTPQPAMAVGPEGDSTTHLTVADGEGNVVSYTFTIEMTGGSGMVVPGYGFLLNNELTDFTPSVPHPNTPEPGKRPRSSMAPTLVMSPDGSILALGSPGGSTIITTVLQVLVNHLALGLDLEKAIAAPRLSQQNQIATRIEEAWIGSDTAQALQDLGHTLEPTPVLGAVTAIVQHPDGTLQAVTEPSRYGGGSARVVNPSTT
jgi:gamma-glutamyltranspeptidase/glutathione hydrolase